MAEITLVAGAGLAATAAAIFAYVGSRLSHRKVSPESVTAAQAFVLWWYGLSLTTALAALQNVLAYGGIVDPPLHLTILLFNLLVVCVALAGLVFYLVFLYSGRAGAAYYVGAFYVLVFVGLLYYAVAFNTGQLIVKRWNVTMLPDAPTSLLAILILAIVGPEFGGAVALLALRRRLEDPTARYRVTVVGLSLLLWLGIVTVGAVGGLSANDLWQIVSRVVSIGAAFGVLLAYFPPPFVQRRLGVQAVAARGGRDAHPLRDAKA